MKKIWKSFDSSAPSHVKSLFSDIQKEIKEKGMLRRRAIQSSVSVKSFDPDKEMLCSGTANFSAVDRGYEIIPPEAWDTDNYDKNPVVLREHDRERPIGSCIEYKIDDNGLHVDFRVGKPEAAPLTAHQIEARSLIAQDVLRALSVGFIPHIIEYDEDQEIIRYTQVELLEFSVVAIPMQQDSLITSVKSFSRRQNMKTKADGENQDKPNDEVLEAIRGVAELMKECLEKLEKMGDKPEEEGKEFTDEDEEEAKALRKENRQLKKKLEDMQDQLDSTEKSVNELLEDLQKQGLIEDDSDDEG